MSARVAAFFDLDGTLLPLPSLERRLFRALRYRREIPVKNYFLWLRETLKLFPHNITVATHANKMYLKGVPSLNGSGAGTRGESSAYKNGHQEEGQTSMPPRQDARQPVPHFFEEGVERVVWHAGQGHVFVIVSGTLGPLANSAAQALETELAERGIVARIRACATKLEERDGRWTGKVLGKAMFGKAKARAIFALAEEMSLDLPRCWAYGDGAQDRWMLAVVGKPVAVNPSARLARIAKKRGWPVLRWRAQKNLTQSPQRTHVRGSMRNEVLENECAPQDAERCA